MLVTDTLWNALLRSSWPTGEGEGVLSNVAEALAGLGDLERGITRSLHGTAAPAEFVTVLRRMASIAPNLGVPVSRSGALAIGPYRDANRQGKCYLRMRQAVSACLSSCIAPVLILLVTNN
jgi:hypothetical protein